jgi:hypothetical protein
LLGLLCHQMHAQYIGEKMMVAIPISPVIQWNEKQIAPLQTFQSRLASWLRSDGVTERAVQAVKNRGLQQKVSHRLKLALQDFLDQIIHNIAMVAGKGLDEPVHILLSVHRKCGHLQTGNPALCAAFQCGNIFHREIKVRDLIEKFCGLGQRKAQVRGAEFGQLIAGTQARDRQRRVFTGGDDQMHLGRQVVDDKGKRLINRLCINKVIVIQNEEKAIGHCRDLVEQSSQNGFDGWPL